MKFVEYVINEEEEKNERKERKEKRRIEEMFLQLIRRRDVHNNNLTLTEFRSKGEKLNRSLTCSMYEIFVKRSTDFKSTSVKNVRKHTKLN